jgi:anti-sigma factor RsiW
MTCEELRLVLLDLQRGRLAVDARHAADAHLAGCPGCARANEVESALSDVLERRLPQYPASPALKRRLAELAPAVAEPAAVLALRPDARRRRLARVLAPALAAAFAVATAALLVERATSRPSGPLAALTDEAVNDYLRVLQRERPVEVESGGTHQVKPWFEGKLDFAPSVPAPVAAEMRLEGGAVGYFRDRKAAVIVYALRRHVVTLFAFRADGLDWPRGAAPAAGGRPIARSDERGFHVFLWRAGDLGYALVSDADPVELGEIAAKLAHQT